MGLVKTLVPALSITIYPTEAGATKAASLIGGLVLESTADKLKGRFRDVGISDEDDFLRESEEFKAATASPWPRDPKPMACVIVPYEFLGEDSEEGFRFTSEDKKWLERFERESGIDAQL